MSDASAIATAVGEAEPAAPGHALGNGPLLRRLRGWATIFAAYFGSQTLIQVLGLLAGLLLIRNMPVQEFALYTLATSVITFFTFATDLGSTSSLVHFYRRAREAGEDFSRYVAAVLSLRRRAFLLGAVIVALALPALGLAKGFRPLDIGLATGAVLIVVAFHIIGALRVLALRLDDRFARSYRAEVAGAALRFLLVGAMVASALLYSWLGLLVAAAGAALTVVLAADGRAKTDHYRENMAGEDLARPRRAVLRYLLPTLPSAAYFAVQGPLVIWIAATFGPARNIAEVGALSRLGLLVGIFSGLTGVVFLPRLARITEEGAYRRRVVQFGAVHLVLASSLLAAAWLLPAWFLWLLGPSYAGLRHELLLVVASAGVALLDGYCVAVNLARSWTRWQPVALAALVIAQVVLAATLDLSTSMGVLAFGLASATAALLSQLLILAVGFAAPARATWT